MRGNLQLSKIVKAEAETLAAFAVDETCIERRRIETAKELHFLHRPSSSTVNGLYYNTTTNSILTLKVYYVDGVFLKLCGG